MTPSEERVQFTSQGLVIEGLLGRRPGTRGMIVTHPHPLYGGDMHNDVVAAVTDTYAKAGYTTLRFNFRGVGGSQGQYDHGIGEQHDIRAALSWLARLGTVSIDVVGYSFGAWVTALGAQGLDTAQQLILIAPPVAFLDFAKVHALPQLALVIVGGEDSIAGVEDIRTAMATWNSQARLRIIEGADHFFSGKTDLLCREIKAILS